MAEQKLSLGYCSLSDPEYGFKELGPEKLAEILIPGPILTDKKLVVILTYPMWRPAKFKLTPDDPELGYTRKEIIEGVIKMYERVYEVERRTVSAGFDPDARMGGMSLNRGMTNGKYGIWGHDMEDLFLHTGYYDEKANELNLGIDS